MDDTETRVAVVGSGYWGKNLVRTFHALGALECVCDVREEVRREVQSRYGVRTTGSFEAILGEPGIQGIAVAAPAAQHYDLVKQCLQHGKDVYVEKPLALTLSEGQELVQLAAEHGQLLMVGHILEYHPAVLELKRLVREGHLGSVRYIYSSRLNLGKLRTEENILWSFAPHDISAMLFLLDELPHQVSAHGGTYVNSHIVDTTVTTCDFKSGAKAHFFVSWLHPFKEQKLVVIGGKQMAVFDDVETERKLTVFSHRIEWIDRTPIVQKAAGQVIPIENKEPLREECAHFLQCIRTRQSPRTNGASALRVMQVLDACERSLRSGGEPVELRKEAVGWRAHPSAIVEHGCEIGEDTRIWHFSHVMSGSRLGRGCNVGQNVVISPGVRIGNNVKIQNNVSVYTGVELEDDVFCGPSMVFTNVINPRSRIARKHEYKRTLVKQGATIGANATVICGVTLGRFSFIGAGAVVTRDVPDYALMIGVPAKQIAWMCYCGVRLVGSGSRVHCSSCERRYVIHGGTCSELTTPTPELVIDSGTPVMPQSLAS